MENKIKCDPCSNFNLIANLFFKFIPSQFSTLTNDESYLSSPVQPRANKIKNRLNKIASNSEGIHSKSPIRFPILQKHVNNTFSSIHNKNFSPDQPMDQAMKSFGKQTKYLINYPTSSYSDCMSIGNVTSLNGNNNSSNNDSNTRSNVNTILNDTSSSNLMSIPIDSEQTDSTVILSEFKLS